MNAELFETFFFITFFAHKRNFYYFFIIINHLTHQFFVFIFLSLSFSPPINFIQKNQKILACHLSLELSQ